METQHINTRYSDLAEQSCCLSCGGAINYSELSKGEVCVDLGSGRGTDVLRMAQEVGSQGFVYGVDISQGMINKSRQNAEKLGINNVKFIQCELENIEIKDNTADLIISNCTINHAANKLKVWQEVFRILKPGGRFVVSDIFSLQTVPAEYATDPVAVAECWAGSITKDEYFDILNKAGFSNINIIEESTPYPKGKIEVCSFTISGRKVINCSCSCK